MTAREMRRWWKPRRSCQTSQLRPGEVNNGLLTGESFTKLQRLQGIQRAQAPPPYPAVGRSPLAAARRGFVVLCLIPLWDRF